jgi:hypothetical protein
MLPALLSNVDKTFSMGPSPGLHQPGRRRAARRGVGVPAMGKRDLVGSAELLSCPAGRAQLDLRRHRQLPEGFPAHKLAHFRYPSRFRFRQHDAQGIDRQPLG